MPVSECPHCHTQLWVKEAQMNLAQGFVMCSQCEGLFQAKSHLREMNPKVMPGQLPNAVTDINLIRKVGASAHAKKTFTKGEIADLLEDILDQKPSSEAIAKQNIFSGSFNWLRLPYLSFSFSTWHYYYERRRFIRTRFS